MYVYLLMHLSVIYVCMVADDYGLKMTFIIICLLLSIILIVLVVVVALRIKRESQLRR